MREDTQQSAADGETSPIQAKINILMRNKEIDHDNEKDNKTKSQPSIEVSNLESSSDKTPEKKSSVVGIL